MITGTVRFGEYMDLGKPPRLRSESLCWLIIAHVKSSTCRSQPPVLGSAPLAKHRHEGREHPMHTKLACCPSLVP
jgi:hypothetical protein